VSARPKAGEAFKRTLSTRDGSPRGCASGGITSDQAEPTAGPASLAARFPRTQHGAELKASLAQCRRVAG
jgi:hypothetical protein